jgi:hypothetical protein
VRGLLAALLLSGAAGAGAAHPEAFSSLTISFAAEEVKLELRMQELTLKEVPLWFLDSDSDGHTSTLELSQAWPEVSAYLARTTWISFDGKRADPVWSIQGFEELGEPVAGGGNWFRMVTAAALLPRPASAAKIEVHSELFLEEGNPEHRLAVAVTGLWEEPAQTLLGFGTREWTVALPSAWVALRQYVVLGFWHVLDGWDHLAFVAALMFGVASLGGLLAAVTAFTAAHSITLALSALGFFSLPPRVVEPAIAWSVLLVILAHLRSGPARAHAWLPAFAFGLLHGFGFAGVLGEIGLPEESRLSGLLGFNLGVEAGQLAFVLPVAALALAARRLLPDSWPALRRTAGLIVLAFALYLVGGATRSYWIVQDLPGPEVWSLAACGAAAAAISALLVRLLVVPHGVPEHRLRPLVLQAVLLVACYAAGVSLAGLRG